MSSNNDLISNIDGNIECTISQIEVLNTNSRLKESELHSLEHLKNENDMLKEEIRRLQDENKKIINIVDKPVGIQTRKRTIDCLSGICDTKVTKKSNKDFKKQNVTKQYENFKSMLSEMTCKKLPPTNIEVFKDPNTYFVSLLFENRNLIRLVRKNNKKLSDKISKIGFEKEGFKTRTNINISKNYEDKTKNILLSTRMMYNDFFANK